MTKKFLITRPKYDIATSYLYDFSEGITKLLRKTKDIHITSIELSDVNRKNFENALNKETPKLIFLNGHGDRNSVLGHQDAVILDKNNVKLAKDSITYALACDSLEDLGKIAITEGAIAYIGYRAKFMIVRDPSRTSSPSKDKNALPFKKACNSMINALVFGNTVEKSIELTKKEYVHSIKSYGTSKDDPYGDVPLIRFALAWDLEFLDFEGNPNASFWTR